MSTHEEETECNQLEQKVAVREYREVNMAEFIGNKI